MRKRISCYIFVSAKKLIIQINKASKMTNEDSLSKVEILNKYAFSFSDHGRFEDFTSSKLFTKVQYLRIVWIDGILYTEYTAIYRPLTVKENILIKVKSSFQSSK